MRELAVLARWASGMLSVGPRGWVLLLLLLRELREAAH